MNVFSEKSIWASPSIDKVIDLLEKDYKAISDKDPFISELCQASKEKGNVLSNFKTQYWPSLINAIEESNVYIRTLALNIMVNENSAEIKKKIWNHFEDPYPFCRYIMVSHFTAENRNRLYHEIFQILIKDPINWIREMAAKRILRDFPDLLSYNFSELEITEQFHILELINVQSTADKQMLEQSLKLDKELAIHSLYKLMDHGLIEEWILENEHTSELIYLSETDLLAVSNFIDIHSIQDFDTALNYIQFAGMENRLDLLLDFIKNNCCGLESDKDRDKILKQMIPIFEKDDESIISSHCIGEWLLLLVNTPILLGTLIPMITIQRMPVLSPYIAQLLQDDHFIMDEKWSKKLTEMIQSPLKSTIIDILQNSPWDSPVMEKALFLSMNFQEKEFQELLILLLSRDHLDPSPFLKSFFHSLWEKDAAKMDKRVSALCKKFPMLLGQVIMVSPWPFISELFDEHQEIIAQENSDVKIGIIEHIQDLDNQELTEKAHIFFQGDPSLWVREAL